MLKKRSPLVWLRWGILLIVAAWFWFAPQRAWNRFLEAVDSGSFPQLEESVDISRLQEHLWIDLNDALMLQPGTADTKTREMASKDFLKSLVEAASSAEGIQETVAGFGYQGPATLETAIVEFHHRTPMRMEVTMRTATAPESEAGLFTIELTSSGWRVTRIRSNWLAGKQT